MEETISSGIKLTQYSHGAGCGCKISPKLLEEILKTDSIFKTGSVSSGRLLVGNDTKDDAAVYDIGNGQAIISTTDFFMPIVDDAYDFGRIASANAISDVYAMGGRPLMAISILGWPINKIDAEIASQVLEGSRTICSDAGISLAGGHSIDSPEPIFGLAVTGIVETKNIKTNSSAREGDLLFLTKPLGTGILSTASKKGLLKENDLEIVVGIMTTLNRLGEKLGGMPGINAITDVTGFGLLGHLAEMTEASGLSAEIYLDDVPLISGLDEYIQKNCIPGGTNRNWESYRQKISPVAERTRKLFCDPQTSGGLLIAVDPKCQKDFIALIDREGLEEPAGRPIGRMLKKGKFLIDVIEE